MSENGLEPLELEAAHDNVRGALGEFRWVANVSDVKLSEDYFAANAFEKALTELHFARNVGRTTYVLDEVSSEVVPVASDAEQLGIFVRREALSQNPEIHIAMMGLWHEGAFHGDRPYEPIAAISKAIERVKPPGVVNFAVDRLGLVMLKKSIFIDDGISTEKAIAEEIETFGFTLDVLMRARNAIQELASVRYAELKDLRPEQSKADLNTDPKLARLNHLRQVLRKIGKQWGQQPERTTYDFLPVDIDPRNFDAL